MPRWSSGAWTWPTSGPARRSTSAGWPCGTTRRSRSPWTGGPRSPSRSTGPRAGSRWEWGGAATSPRVGRSLLGVEDEYFGDGKGEAVDGQAHLKGAQTLAITMEQARTGRLGDIIATIQSEQDEIIRDELSGILVVQGGPGTGKTVVALHRGRLPALHPSVPARGPGCAGHRPEPALPDLHRAGAAIAGRGRRPVVRVERSGATSPRARVRPRARRPGQGRPGDVARAPGGGA